ncbi:hypothetical protein BC629DRAFT_1597128 [Irpex lacteus]|nr:hypothetical protein BC629DRAFT_1597128 [Irpex lacteus]
MQFRIGFVSYAPSSTQPTPLLSRTFFTSPPALFKDLTTNPAVHGVGHTGSGGGKGMAALEGMVAVLELFDRFKETAQHKTDAVQIKAHVIHLAACQPDAAQRPIWNVSPALDNVTWETLPSEFRKRDINYSLIQLRPIPRLNELYNLVAATGSQEPWFKVRPGHSVRLMGYPPALPKSGAKRSIDSNPSPDTKRQKVSSQPSPRVTHATPQQKTNTPKLAPATAKPPNPPPQIQPSPVLTTPTPLAPAPAKPPPQVQPHPPASQPPAKPPVPTPQPSSTQSQPPQPAAPAASALEMSLNANTVPAAIAGLSPEKFQQFLARLDMGEKKMAQQEAMAKAAEAAGQLEEAKKIREALGKTMFSMQKFRDIVRQVELRKAQERQQQRRPEMAQSGEVVNPNQAPPGSASQPIIISPKREPTALPAPSSPSTVPAHIPPGAVPSHLSPQRAAAQVHAPPPTHVPGPAPSTVRPPQASPQMATQMQKLIEQRNRATPHVPPANAPGMALPQQSPAPPQAPVGGGPAQLPHWRGLLTWSGSDSGTHVRREMRASVAMLANRHSEPIDFSSWPSLMAISPSRERAVPVPVLQEWMKKHKCNLFGMHALPQTPDTKAMNEESFKTLWRLLTEKGIYAVAAWNTQNGPMENRILIFPVKTQLYAAYFPTPGGMPELPKPPVNLEIAQKVREVMARLSPEEQKSLMEQPPDRRMAWLQSFAMRQQQNMLQQQQQRQQQQQQQQQQLPPHQQPQFPPQQSSHMTAMQAMAASNPAFQQQLLNANLLNNFPGVVQQQHPQQMPPGAAMMNYGAVGIPPPTQGGMHQRTPSGNSMMQMSGLPPGVTMEMMQSLMGNRPH